MDLLALQGVIPVRAPATTPAGGLRLGQADGSWVTGAGSPAGIAGLRPGQLDGSWITGAPSAIVDNPSLRLGQLDGSWITGAPVVAPTDDHKTRTHPRFQTAVLRDDEEILMLVQQFIRIKKWLH